MKLRRGGKKEGQDGENEDEKEREVGGAGWRE